MKPWRYDSEAVKRIRIARGLDVPALAEKARMSKNSVYLYERGNIPKASTLAQIANALGVSVGAFYRRTN